MKVLILGSGVIGVTSAYALMKRGHEVVVLDRQDGSAKECSYSNGGQLSYSHVEPWATPHVLPKVIKWLGKKDAPLIFRLRLDPAMWKWALQFLRHCTPAKSAEGIRIMMKLAQYSQASMQGIINQTGITFDYTKTGALRLFVTERSWENGIKDARLQQDFGYPYEVLGQKETIAKEPALGSGTATFAGSVYYPQDELGDAYRFTVELAEYCQRESDHAIFQYNTHIVGIESDGEKVTGVVTNKGTLTADAYVVALGADSPLLLKRLGIHLPIYPLKGYSLSLPVGKDNISPHISVTDMERKIVCSRLGNVLRVAGTAELTGYDTSHTDYRIAPLLRQVQELFPNAGDFSQVTHWACLRPSTPNGIPIIGTSPYKNLYMNTGHGSLGWTLAAGSAFALADVIDGNETAIDLSRFALNRG